MTCGIFQPSSCGHYPQHPDAGRRVCRNGGPHSYGASLLCACDEDEEPLAHCRAHDPVHEHDDPLALPTDPAMGRLLSRAMFPIVGIRLLFFGDQLFDCGVRRHCPPASLASAWTGRGDHGCLDVWNFRKCAVCHCGAAHRKRGAVGGWTPISAESKNSDARLVVSQFGNNFPNQPKWLSAVTLKTLPERTRIGPILPSMYAPILLVVFVSIAFACKEPQPKP